MKINLQRLIKWQVSGLGILALLFSTSLFAEPTTTSDWLEADKRFKEFCQQQVVMDAGKVFPDTAVKAKKIRTDYCARKITTDKELQLRIISLLDDLDRLFVSEGYHQQMKRGESQRMLQNTGLAILEVFVDPALYLVLEENKVKVKDVRKCDVTVKAISSSGNCQSALMEFKRIYNFAHGTLSQPKALELVQYLDGLEKQWDDFYENGRSQTIWEMLINGKRFQSDNQEHKFMPPPDSQLIVMHPGLVIENVSDSLDGDQTKEAIMLEVIGINWWRNSKWYKPSGISAIALYTDRAGVEDVGYGLAIHFANKFTLGYSDHDGADGYFISVDLLELLKDKKTLLNEYRGSLEF